MFVSHAGPFTWYMYVWLVVWNMTSIFPYIGNNHPNWLIFFTGVQTTNQMSMGPLHVSMVLVRTTAVMSCLGCDAIHRYMEIVYHTFWRYGPGRPHLLQRSFSTLFNLFRASDLAFSLLKHLQLMYTKVGITIEKQPFGNGLYQLSMVIWEMVSYIHISGFHCESLADFSPFPGLSGLLRPK